MPTCHARPQRSARVPRLTTNRVHHWCVQLVIVGKRHASLLYCTATNLVSHALYLTSGTTSRVRYSLLDQFDILLNTCKTNIRVPAHKMADPRAIYQKVNYRTHSCSLLTAGFLTSDTGRESPRWRLGRLLLLRRRQDREARKRCGTVHRSRQRLQDVPRRQDRRSLL